MVTDEPRTLTFEQFFLVEYPRLVTMLTAWTGDRATAEDLAQDALVQAEHHWARVASLDSPGSWVRRVALNRSSNEGRRRGRERRALRRIDVADATGDVPTSDAGLWSTVRALPPAQRQAIVLRYVDDLPLSTIAAIIGCSEGTVKTHLQRGRAAIREQIGTTTHGEER